MMKLYGAMAATAALLIGVPAIAQEAQAPASPAAAAPAAGVSDADVTKFAKLLVQLKDLEKQGKAADQETLLKAVETLGLSIDAYNTISGGMRDDKAMADRVNAAFQKEATAAQAATAPAGAPAQN